MGLSEETKKAEEALVVAMNEGHWVLLQNCHLVVEWLPTLETIFLSKNDTCHSDFRIWMTTESVEDFPVLYLSIFQFH